MPTYQYECDACGHTFEILQSMLDKKLKKCPDCGEESLYRLIGAGSGIIFKGSGFYETDYKRKESPSGASATGTKGDAKPAGETKKAEQKPSDGKKSEEKTKETT